MWNQNAVKFISAGRCITGWAHLLLAVYLLFWDKLPNWGNWFKSLIKALPQPLQTLYGQWTCAYCAGFWIALVLHAVTGLWTIPALATPPEYMGILGVPVNWFLDALASATLIYTANMALKAMGLPILRARLLREGAASSPPIKMAA